jgi:signal transduction histidine kinase/ligand-binding sensor domain-containing protein
LLAKGEGALLLRGLGTKLARVFRLVARWGNKGRNGFLLALLWLVALAGGAGFSIAYGADGSGLSFDIWQVQQGLEQNPITAVVQTRDGYLWLGTYTGLLRFDGVRVTTFGSVNTPGLLNSRVTSLYEDSQGVLWIGHETGEVTRYSGGEFHPAGRVAGWPGGAVEAITTDEGGDLWLLNNTGILVRLRDGRSLLPPGGGSASRKVGLSREPSGKVWLAGNGKVATLVRGELMPFTFDDVSGTNFFERVIPAQDGGLWVMESTGLRKWREGRWVMDLGMCPCESGYVTDLLETRSGKLLAGTVRDGLYLLTPWAKPLHFARTNGLSHDWVRALCEDREGNIWIGTGDGLNALRPRKVQMINSPDEWQGRAVLSFVVGRAGDPWVGTEGAGLYHREGNRWTCVTETNGLSNLFVWSVLSTRAGELFVGTWGGGLFVKRGDRFEASGELSRITAPVVALYEGSHRELWIGTTLGLHRYEGGKLTWSAGKELLGSPDVRAITETPDGALWFGTLGGGLGCLKDDTLKQFRKTNGLSSDFVLSLYAETDGTLWIGTSDNGLCRLRGGHFATISTPQGMLASIISQIADDGAGNLWLGSHQGILRVSKADLNRCADGQAASVRCLSYGKAEGLATLKCSGGFQPNVCQSADGRLWFPTAKGLAVIDPRGFTTNMVPPPVVIEELLVDQQPVKIPGSGAANRSDGSRPELKIPPGKQQFELRYTGLSFTAPDKVRFKYKLDGLGQDWVDAGTRREATFGYLSPGTYMFRVTACNNDDVWNPEGASLSFTVLPYFWQTWWFRTVVLVVGAGGIAALAMWVARRRVRRRVAQLERQRALERERARIARDIHDDLGSSLTRISLLSQGVRAALADHEAAAADADQIYATARELTRAMDEIVWAVNPQHDTLDSLVAYLGRFAQSFLSTAGIRCRLDVPLHLPPSPLTSEIRHNTFLAFKEALNNVVKHAHASEVRISMELKPDGFMLVVADNGRGFSWEPQKGMTVAGADGSRPGGGNGLVNMQKRLEEVGGCCGWDTAPGEGTRAKLIIMVKA